MLRWFATVSLFEPKQLLEAGYSLLNEWYKYLDVFLFLEVKL